MYSSPRLASAVAAQWPCDKKGRMVPLLVGEHLSSFSVNITEYLRLRNL
jgi:hypothetical protein